MTWSQRCSSTQKASHSCSACCPVVHPAGRWCRYCSSGSCVDKSSNAAIKASVSSCVCSAGSEQLKRFSACPGHGSQRVTLHGRRPNAERGQLMSHAAALHKQSVTAQDGKDSSTKTALGCLQTQEDSECCNGSSRSAATLAACRDSPEGLPATGTRTIECVCAALSCSACATW